MTGTGKDGAATPQWLFDALNARVRELTGQGFQLDAAASDWNAKCADYFTEQADALAQDWSGRGPIYCNAPFTPTLLPKFAAKAIEAAEGGATVALLLPSWTGYPWFQELKRRGQMADVIGPVEFERADGSKVVLNNGPKTTSLVVATLGPSIAAGTNGEPIRRPGGGEPHAGGDGAGGKGCVGRKGCPPMGKPPKKPEALTKCAWRVKDSLRVNADRLGKALVKAHPGLYRTPQGLIEALPAQGKIRVIDNARKLAPTLIDHLDLQVVRGGKVVGDLPPERSLNALLGTEHFLGCFKPVDIVTALPVYLPDYSAAPPGYHDGGPGRRVLYLGPQVPVASSMEAWDNFLAVMDCDEASRTNILAAALTVVLRHHWPGHKPLILVTANQSHAGKGTVIEAVRGRVPKAAILYQANDWPMEAALHKQLNAAPDVGLIDLDNVRKDSSGVGGIAIRSGFFESLVTSD
jgi:phage N-6-adenine-methyltransferase